MSIEEIIKDLLTAIIAALMGFLTFNKMTLFFRLLFIQVLLYLVIDIVATNYHPNLWLFNIYIFLETLLLFLAAGCYLTSKKGRQVLTLLFSAFIVIYFIELIFFGLAANFAAISSITEGLFVSCIFIHIMFIQLNRKENNSINIPVVTVSLGLVIYFAATVPYLSTLNLRFTNFSSIRYLFQKIVVNLSNVRYLLLAAAFIFLYKGIIFTKKKV